jgi:hypothetical protein
MRRISRLQITIGPWVLRDGMKKLRVEATVNGMKHTAVTPFYDDDFTSQFDWLMEWSRREIVRLVEAHNVLISEADHKP